MAGNKGVGTTIAKGVTNIGILTSISSPEISAEFIDITTLDTADRYKTVIQGLIDGGEVAIAGYLDVTDSGQTTLKTDLDAGTSDSYTITFPTAIGATWTFDAIVTKFKVGEANLSDAVSFEATLKINGKPTLGTSASTGMSACTFVKTDGATGLTALAVTPTFAIAKYQYNVTFTTDTGFKVKPTAASHTIKVYVDDVYLEAVSSGSAGSLISIDAAATKKITVVVYEAAKTPKTYYFMVCRLS